MQKNLIEIKFEDFDNWDRPIFKDINSQDRYGSLDIWFKGFVTTEMVLNNITEDDLTYFGNTFNCKPIGTPVKNIKIIRGK